MFSCLLCEKNEEYLFVSKWCNSCREIKNIMNVYGAEKVNEIVKRVCVRNTTQINNKINLEKKIIDKDEETKEKEELNEKIKKQINKNKEK